MEEKFFLVSEGDKIFRILYSEISHFIARGGRTIVNTKDGQYVHCKNIGNVKKELCGNPHFISTHKSYLLNMNHVVFFSKRDGGFAVLKNGSKIPVSRRQKSEFFKTYLSK